MKKSIVERHIANQKVFAVLKSKEDSIKTVPFFSKSLLELENLLEMIEKEFDQLNRVANEIPGNVQFSKESLADVAYKLSCILKVFAFVSFNKKLLNFLVCSKQELVTKYTPVQLLEYSKELSKYVVNYATSLCDYGLTNELVTGFIIEIADFEIVISQSPIGKSKYVSGSKAIYDYIETIYQLLVNKIDPLMELFTNDKEFYLSYRYARINEFIIYN